MKPEDFPIGPPESRAAARAESERRARIQDETALVFILTGFPRPPRERIAVANVPGLSKYSLPDGSIVDVVRGKATEHSEGRAIIHVEQTWPDGSVYEGDCLVKSLEDLKRLGRPLPE
jgi:hypothetical protein